MKVALAGPYGGANLGDELLLELIAGEIGRLGHSVLALSINPEHTRRRHRIPAAQGLDLRAGALSAFQILRKVDALVVGGGEQIQDGRGGNPISGLLPPVALLLWRARQLGVATMLWGVGVGRVRPPFATAVAHLGLARCDFATARDAASLVKLRQLGCPRERSDLAADPAFALEERSESAAAAYRNQITGILQGPLILLCPSNDPQSRPVDYLWDLTAAACQAARDTAGTVVVLFMDRQPKYDLALLSRPEFRAGDVIKVLPAADYSADQLCLLHRAADVVITARLHPLILAATQATPCLPVLANPKLTHFARTIGIGGLDPALLTKAAVVQRLHRLLATNRASWRSNVRGALDAQKELLPVSRAAFRRLTEAHDRRASGKAPNSRETSPCT